MEKAVRRHIKLVLLVLASSWITPALQAQQKSRICTSTDILMWVPGIAGAASAWAMKDSEGVKQLALTGATAVATNYLLELSIRKKRPDGDGEHAFPSTHSAVAFAGAAFVARRYGWQWGIPAYAVSSYVAWGRVYGRRHDIWDVLGGAALGVGSCYLYTKPFSRKASISISPLAGRDVSCGVHLLAVF